uniref:phycytochrome bilisome core-membrane linker protein n=1 Tax=Glaucosphaera vacuolata TaxID=38265 RepID=UPI001FCD4045|nr:phycytochrome bilisome core-membrane linker protein [Glaucosphaera vacuolata]UNJ18626.1 phycytochrome bilisome core-membrane linker protein [Glaucosphaera vacuolata]
MSTNFSSGSPVVFPQMYKTVSIATILQAEKQDRFLQIGELNQLTTFLKSGNKRLEIAEILAKNANLIVAKAADQIFVGGSAISYLERPQSNISISEEEKSKAKLNQQLAGNVQVDLLENIKSIFVSRESNPSGFKPINVVRYGPTRMRKSLRDLDWFLRYLTYAIVAGDPNILSVNIRNLKAIIENACSSAATIVALREMKRVALSIFVNDPEAQEIVAEYASIILSDFQSPALADKIRKRISKDEQGLRLPQSYSLAEKSSQRFVMKPKLSISEKNEIIKACYRQVFERDITKAYNLSLSKLESQLKNGQISVKEMIRALGKSELYRKQFYQPFVNSRVVELACRHFLGRGLSSLKEFQTYFAIVSSQGLYGLIDSLVNSKEYADYFGEETVPYNRGYGEEPQECRNWGAQINLFNYSAPFTKIPQFITLFSDYSNSLPDQHPYGRGNDPLSIQFGAIFPKDTKNPYARPAFFGKNSRRILIHNGAAINNQLGNPAARSTTEGFSYIKVFNATDLKISKETILNAAYLRVFGRSIYLQEHETLKNIENQFLNNNISTKELIRQLAKSNIFRALYWSPLYICKAIEYIHTRLLGRPTYGRQEINKYFDIAYKKGFYQVIDSIIDSREYSESFGDNVIPYERYLAPSGVSLRTLKSKNYNLQIIKTASIKPSKFIELSTVNKPLTVTNILQKMQQGVTSARDQQVIFKITKNSTSSCREQILKAAYRQVFERDINTCSIGTEFINIENTFKNHKITVKELIFLLASSDLYAKEFYRPYPNTKVIEMGTKHLLGRAPNNQAEIRYYNQILAAKGVKAFISAIINSTEYNQIFGDNIVPYRRFPTLPAANFPNTEKLYTQLTKQNHNIIVPSFKAVAGV